MNRCLWCNESSGELRTVTLRQGKERRDVFVHAAHQSSLVDWHARAVNEAQRFVTIVAFAPLFILAAVGLAALVSRRSTPVIIGLALIALAALMWRHPFATPQTVRLMGVRRSIIVVRALTALMALAGTVALGAGLAALRG